jgi:hypothetical protein
LFPLPVELDTERLRESDTVSAFELIFHARQLFLLIAMFGLSATVGVLAAALSDV